MSKGLEALERIKNAPTIYVGCGSDIYTRYSFECNEIEKELKALEIIKGINFIRVYETIGGKYILEVVNDGIELTKDNYETLKEILE